jgi:hypothetical protein
MSDFSAFAPSQIRIRILKGRLRQGKQMHVCVLNLAAGFLLVDAEIAVSIQTNIKGSIWMK